MNSLFETIYFNAIGSLLYINANLRYPVLIQNSSYVDSLQGFITLTPNDIERRDIPLILEIRGCEFSYHSPLQFALLIVTANVKVLMFDSDISYIVSLSQGVFLRAESNDSYVYIFNSSIRNNYASEGVAIYAIDQAYVELDQCKIFNNLAFWKTVISIERNAYFLVSNTLFQENHSLVFSVLGITESIGLPSRFVNSTFIDNYDYDAIQFMAAQTNPIVIGYLEQFIQYVLQQSYLKIDNCLFINEEKIVEVFKSILVVRNSIFKGSVLKQTDGGIFSIVASQVQIASSTFENLTYEFPTLYHSSCLFWILDSKFENLISKSYGGAINVLDGSLTLNNSEFIKNQAEHGGAISLRCRKQGGAIYYNKNRPKGIEQEEFDQSDSAPYGNSIASYGFGIRILIDYDGQRMTNDEISQDNHFQTKLDRTLSIEELDQNLKIVGSKSAKIRLGVATFSNLTFFAPPNYQNAKVRIYSPNIDSMFLRTLFATVNQSFINNGEFEISFRECIQGEIQTADSRLTKHTCGICPEQWKSSLKAFGLFILIFSALSLLVYFNISSGKKSSIVLVLRIATNYLQVISTIGAYNLNWPIYLREMFGVYETVGLYNCVEVDDGDFRMEQEIQIKCWRLRSECYYWEFMNIIRKTLLVAVNVFLQAYRNIFKSILSIIVLSFFLQIQNRLKPYKDPLINRLEYREYLSNLVIFFASLFFVNTEISNEIQLCAFIIVVLFNLNFVFLWIYSLISIGKYSKLRVIQQLLEKFVFISDEVLQKHKVIKDSKMKQKIQIHIDNKESNKLTSENDKVDISRSKDEVIYKQNGQMKLENIKFNHFDVLSQMAAEREEESKISSHTLYPFFQDRSQRTVENQSSIIRQQTKIKEEIKKNKTKKVKAKQQLSKILGQTSFLSQNNISKSINDSHSDNSKSSQRFLRDAFTNRNQLSLKSKFKK
ncbi:UNKNOWN [Stylonychia lemnae]|uniref:TRP C-terminal domain-containing protein n=1 Tax=Stylonychia lemnae TaxID=5949 RepID=A0A078AJ27_STYLE|nr:UNKNOWN [Stylonychia lemnae]|eukprot:CDW82330.1 UNKNOWN [Stylonychia lemnae]